MIAVFSLLTISFDVFKNIFIPIYIYSYSYQGYLLYRDANNHSMTAVRINPETLEQDGTVALPGKNLQIQEDGYSLLL